jgi:glutaredoxin 3
VPDGQQGSRRTAEAAPFTMANVVIYTRDYCFFCESAKELLHRKRIAFTEIDVTGNRDHRAEMIGRANGRTSVPQIFVGSTHVGGCDDLYALEKSGRLDHLLAGDGGL